MLLLHAVRLTREKKFKVEKRCDLTRKSNKNGLIFRVDPPMGHCCTYVIVAVSFFANIQQRNCVCDVTHHVTCGPKKHTMSYRYPNIHIQIEMRSDKIGPSVGPFHWQILRESAPSFVNFATQRLVRSSWTQKNGSRAFKELSNGVKMNELNYIFFIHLRALTWLAFDVITNLNFSRQGSGRPSVVPLSWPAMTISLCGAKRSQFWPDTDDTRPVPIDWQRLMSCWTKAMFVFGQLISLCCRLFVRFGCISCALERPFGQERIFSTKVPLQTSDVSSKSGTLKIHILRLDTRINS